MCIVKHNCRKKFIGYYYQDYSTIHLKEMILTSDIITEENASKILVETTLFLK